MNSAVSMQDLYPSRIGSKPKILSRKDPVVYSDASKPCPLDREHIDFYENNGYLFLERFFDANELKAMRDELDKLWEEGKTSDRPEVIRELESQEVRSIFAVHQTNELFKKVSEHPKVRAIVQYILGGDVYVHQSRINFKPGFQGEGFYWHSDFETWHIEDGMPRMRALSCSIALTDNHMYNGPLMVLPGSHREYVACVGETPEGNYKSSLKKQVIGVPDEENITRMVDEYGVDIPVGPAGSVLLFDCNVMHGSSSNISPRPRSNVFFVFNSVENKLIEPFSGKKPRPEYIAAREGM